MTDPAHRATATQSSDAMAVALPLLVGTAVALLPLPPAALAPVAFGAALLLGVFAGDRPFRTGVLLTLPGAVVGIVQVVGDSAVWIAVVVLITPPVAVVNGLVVRFGAALKRDSAHARRGRILVAVWAGVFAIGAAWFRVGTEVMDERIASVERDLAAALDDQDPETLLNPYSESGGKARVGLAESVGGADLVGGPFGEVRFRVHTWWAPWDLRCVLARPTPGAAWELRTANDNCDDISWDAAS